MSARVCLAAFLALALLAVFTAVLFHDRPVSGPTALQSPARGAGAHAGAAAAREPGLHAPEGRTADLGQAAAAGAPAGDLLARLQGSIPALERASWAEIAAALAGDSDSRKLPRALRALALELAGTVRTAASVGQGELTQPVVLSRILEEVLERGGEPLTAPQREKVAGLASRSNDEIERVLEGLETRPRLASTLLEIEVKLGFIGECAGLLGSRQREALDRLVERGAPLSPLDLIEAQEFELADAASFQRGIASELDRELGIDPVLAESLALRLWNDLAPLMDGSAEDLSAGELALVAARAQARMLEDILRAPGLGPKGRERALGPWVVLVPRPRRAGR